MKFTWSRAVEAEITPHLLLWGDSGTGKTAAAVRGPADLDLDLRAVARGEAEPVGDSTVFLLTFERNALSTARFVNPKAGYFLAETKAQAWEVLEAALGGELVRAGFERLAIDGLTELQRLIGATLKREADDFWMELATRTTTMLRMIRSIPMRITATALEQTRPNEKTKVVAVSPSFEMRNVPGQAMSMFAGAGRTTRVGEGDSQTYAIDFNLPSRYAVKEVAQVRGRVKPCAAALIEVLEGKRPYSEIRFGGPPEPTEAEAPKEVDTGTAGTVESPKARKISR